jgi:hypothetical protein
MYVENIILDLENIIYDAKMASVRAFENRREADRTFLYVGEGEEYTQHGYDTVATGLVDASHALDKANDDFLKVELKLLKIIEDIKMEALSAKVQAK